MTCELSKMRIVFIGSGNVATHLSVALKKSGNEIIQVYSKTLKNAKLLASQVEAEPIDNLKSIKSNADLYIFSLKDDMLSEIVKLMPATDGIWAHTSGSLPMNLFSLVRSSDYGVIYPLQTFSKIRFVDFQGIPVFIEGDSN
ncbi:MAG: NAD(P)-binding domain-containing protein, partial [Fermentimonas sp.]|nr:NAD(P)-binding domain-containing protein [Fermentimonas sp.]